MIKKKDCEFPANSRFFSPRLSRRVESQILVGTGGRGKTGSMAGTVACRFV
ncbi:MAG: hypothetical protein ACTSUE_17150 [Promethearchaeota archaeon]